MKGKISLEEASKKLDVMFKRFQQRLESSKNIYELTFAIQGQADRMVAEAREDVKYHVEQRNGLSRNAFISLVSLLLAFAEDSLPVQIRAEYIIWIAAVFCLISIGLFNAELIKGKEGQLLGKEIGKLTPLGFSLEECFQVMPSTGVKRLLAAYIWYPYILTIAGAWYVSSTNTGPAAVLVAVIGAIAVHLQAIKMNKNLDATAKLFSAKVDEMLKMVADFQQQD